MNHQIIKPDSENQVRTKGISVFLAGSIDNGSTEDWQSEMEDFLKEHHITIYNPRREEWDPNLVQEEDNPIFNGQVNWELNHLEEVDIAFLYLVPGSIAPISMFEFGLLAKSGRIIVCCPNGFWRKGNTNIICTRYNIPLYKSLKEAQGGLLTKIAQIR